MILKRVRILALTLTLALCTVSVTAQEVIVDFEDKSLPILNEELKSINKKIRNINASLSNSSGILGTDHGGTGSDLLSADDYSLFYMTTTGTFGTLAPGSSGQVLVTNGSSNPPDWDSLGNFFGEVFLTSGTYVAPAGVTRIFLTMVGGGGGGGGRSNSTVGGGGGGGAEAYINKSYNVVAGNSYVVTVGAGGSGGVGATDSTVGGDSIFNDSETDGTSELVATGGGRGLDGSGVSNAGGAGAAAGSLNGVNTTTSGAGGFYSFAGGTGGTSNGDGGSGGGSLFGRGGKSGADSSNGSSGEGFGSGGGGADDGSFPLNGGNGSNGFVIITYSTIVIAGGGGGGVDSSTVTLKVGGTIEQSGTFTMDFNGSQFSSSESPTGEENISIINLSGTNTGDQDLSTYVVGPASATDNAVARFNSTTGKLIQNSGVLIDDQANITTTGSLDVGGTLTVGTLTTAVPNSRFRIGVQETNKKGLVVQMPAGTTETAFEIQTSTGTPKAKFNTVGNSALVLNYSGTMVPATYPGYVLSVQNIGDSGEGAWIEILNSGGTNQGAFFGMYGNQFQLFNWQGGDIEFWTNETASNGYVTLTIGEQGNLGLAGGLEYAWSHGWGGGKGVMGIGDAATKPTTSVTNAALLYSDAGSLWTMDSDTTKTRLGTRVVALTDGSTPALNAKLGDVFTLSAAGDRTIAVPSNPISGQRIIIRHTASGANRTLALNTGTGGFRFGTTITALTITTSGLTDYIECIYNVTANKWDVISYNKGF